MSAHSTWAVVLAAGKGRRLARYCGSSPKQFLTWQGKPLWWHSARVLASSPLVSGLVFVFPHDMLEEASLSLSALDEGHVLGIPWQAIAGGPRRQDSVRLSLAALPHDCGFVLVHDSARPFLTPSLVSAVMEPLLKPRTGHEDILGVVPGLPLTDTIKEVLDCGAILRTPPRTALRAVQTPQAFALAPLREAHARAQREGCQVTDDASVMEYCGHKVLVVPGEENNKKITLPQDLALLEAQRPLSPCAGYGYDVHRYGGDRPLVLGSVPIPGSPGVLAHSDGDVLLHALMDAILGCIGGGDIGTHFPDSDPTWENVSSALLLDRVLQMAGDQHLRIAHVDLTVVAQKPRLAPHAQAIRRNVARLLSLDEKRVNFKATTEEGLGFTGEGAGLKAVALVSGLR